MNNPNWIFASTGGGFEEGINNTLTEHFEGNYNYYLAREIIQNSIDARDRKNEPVKVCFSSQRFSRNEFPGHERFTEILDLCLKSHSNNPKTVQFFQNAMNLFKKDDLWVLKVSDYNSTGLYGGDKERDKPWYSLVKSRGVSGKFSGEGGSFGLGKGAAFAASEFRTVFYCTTSKKDAKSRFIGVSILVNFDEDGDTKQSIGTFGLKNQQTIYDPKLMGDFWRKEKGLDIYIMGYRIEKNWKDDLAKSVLRNFWYAIANEDLQVSIDNLTIDFNNLESLLSKYFMGEPFKDYIEPKGNPLYFYKSVLSNTSKKFEKNLKHIGKSVFYYLPLEDSLNYVAMLRKSHMVIYSKAFYQSTPYAGVFVCDDQSGNEMLKKMEPPAHDKWDPARFKPEGRKIMDEIEMWIRTCLKSVKKEKNEEISDMPELAKLLPLSDDIETTTYSDIYSESNSNEETSKLISDNQNFKLKSKIDPYKVSVLNKEETGLGGTGIVVRTGTKKRNKNNQKAPGSGTGKNRALASQTINARVIGLSGNFTNQKYLILIKSNKNGKCNLKFKGVGENGNEKIHITSVIDSRGFNYKVSNNCVYGFYLDKDQKVSLELSLKEKLKCSLIIEANEIQ
ncbi:hypothetical protein [Mariniphaga sp.]|uniref:hypothetical protein n=1 Tax=Mariniphaga sp. TaxID=1954475 RepID=UPI003564D21E